MAFVLYTRRGCHLCELAEELLAAHGQAAEIVDIDADPDLRRLYDIRVPVLAAHGVVVLEGRFHEADLVRALAGGVTCPASVPGDPGRRRAPRPT